MLNSKFRFSLKESFGLKMLASFIVVIVVVLSAFTLFAVVHESNKAKAGLREQGEMLSGLLAHGAVVGVFAENEKMLANAAEGALRLKDVVSISIYNARLKILYAKSKTPSGKDASPLHENSVQDLGAARSTSVIETAHTFEVLSPVMIKSASKANESLYFGGTVENESGKVIGYVRIVLSKGSYHKEILTLLTQNAVIMLIFIFSSIAIVYLAVKKVTRPLEKLTESVKALGKGMPVERVPVETGDEIGNLASAFNAMVVARGQAEESLRQSEQRLRLIAETIAEVFWIADVEITRMLYISPGYERVWGRSCESLYETPRSFLGAVHQEDRDRVLTALELKKTGRPIEYECRIIRPDGSIRLIWDRGYPVRDEAGRVTCYVGVAQDITERTKNEEALKTQARVLESMAEGVSVSDERGVIFFTNPAFDAMFGYEPAELIGKSISILNTYAPEENSRIVGEIIHTVLTEGSCSREFSNRKKDGTPFFTFARISALEISGRAFCIAVQEDITARKQAEEALCVYHEQLVALSSELSRTEEHERRRIATDLHDTIGQMLALSKIKLGALREAAPPGSFADDLDEVRAQIDQSIQYTRSLTFELSPPALYELGLEAAVEGLAAQIRRQHGISVNVKKDGWTGKELSDEMRILLFKTVRELLINVVKHADARTATVSIHGDAAHIRITVEDDGTGFDAAKTDLPPGKPSGFGLFSIRERLKYLGGQCGVDSAPGRGTRVLVTAPRRVPKKNMGG
jgi:PAS domain S-box-containing protein